MVCAADKIFICNDFHYLGTYLINLRNTQRTTSLVSTRRQTQNSHNKSKQAIAIINDNLDKYIDDCGKKKHAWLNATNTTDAQKKNKENKKALFFQRINSIISLIRNNKGLIESDLQTLDGEERSKYVNELNKILIKANNFASDVLPPRGKLQRILRTHLVEIKRLY